MANGTAISVKDARITYESAIYNHSHQSPKVRDMGGRWKNNDTFFNQWAYLQDPSKENPRRSKRLWRDVLESNRKHLAKLIMHLRAQGASDGNMQRHLYALKVFGVLCNYDWQQATRDQNIEIMARIISSRRYSPASIKAIKVALNVLYRTLWGKEGEKHPAVRGLKATKKERREEIEPVFSVGQVKDIIQATEKLLYKAIYSMGYEGNLRPHEYLEAKLKQLRPFEHGFMLTALTSKTTGVPVRTIPLIQSAPYLSRYIEMAHPNPDPESPIFVTERGKYAGMPVSNYAANKELKSVCRRLGIKKKKITLYQLRKAGITHKRLSGVPDAIIEKHAGWVTGTAMLKHYSRVTGEDVNRAILEMNGLEATQKQEVLEKKICGRCGTENGAADRYCYRCYSPLETERWLTEQDKFEKAREVASTSLLKKVLPMLSDEQKRELQQEFLNALR